MKHLKHLFIRFKERKVVRLKNKGKIDWLAVIDRIDRPEVSLAEAERILGKL